MTDKQRAILKTLLRENANRDSQNQATARAKLIEEGIYDEDGDLRPEFGGKGFESERTISFI